MPRAMPAAGLRAVMKRITAALLGAAAALASIEAVAQSLGLAWHIAPFPILIGPGAQAHAGADRRVPPGERQALEARVDRARARLRDAPLNAADLRILALDAARQPALPQTGRRQRAGLLATAERVSRRDFVTELALAADGLQNGEPDRALGRLDRALIVYPEGESMLLDALIAGLSDDGVRRAAMRYRNRLWYWRLVNRALMPDRNPGAAVWLLRQNPGVPGTLDASTVRSVIDRLIEVGEVALARRFAVIHARVTPEELNSMAFSSATTRALAVPLTWMLGDRSNVEVEGGLEGKLTVEMQPGVGALIARKVTALPSGRYSLQVLPLHVAGAGTADLVWHVACRPAGVGSAPWTRVLSLPVGDQRADHRITIAPECAAQDWRLMGSSFGASLPVRFEVSELGLWPE